MATYEKSGAIWSIRAEGLDLVEQTREGATQAAPTRTAFGSIAELLAAARTAMRDKISDDYLLDGNVAAGSGTTTPPVLAPSVTRALAALPSFLQEGLAEILEEPADYSGGLLFADGDLEVRGDLDAAQYAAVVVTGNLTVRGMLVQLEEEPIMVVLGDLAATRLLCTGQLHVGRDLSVADVAYLQGDHGGVTVGRDAHIGTTILDALRFTVGGLLSTECAVARNEALFHAHPKPAPIVGLQDPHLRSLFADAFLDASLEAPDFGHFRDLEAAMLLGLDARRRAAAS